MLYQTNIHAHGIVNIHCCEIVVMTSLSRRMVELLRGRGFLKRAIINEFLKLQKNLQIVLNRESVDACIVE